MYLYITSSLSYCVNLLTALVAICSQFMFTCTICTCLHVNTSLVVHNVAQYNYVYRINVSLVNYLKCMWYI